MALSEDFIKAVNSGDTLTTRIMIKDSMLVDLTLKQFKERLDYAESNLTGLYDDHDGEEFPSDITQWNKDLVNRQMARVVTNFSRERVAFLQKLVRTVFADQAKEADMADFVETHQTGLEPKQVGVGVAAIGVVATAVGALASKPVIAVAGIAAVVVGGAIAIVNQ